MEQKTISNATGVQIFKNPAFGQMRVQSNERGQAWFCLSDVCRVLSLTNSSEVKRRLKQPGITTAEVGVQTGTKQDGNPAIQFVNLTFIDEPNLYRCIFQSRKKEAEAFQDWVVEEVLPTIRKTGGYSVPGKPTQKTPVKKLRQAADVYPIIPFSSPILGEIRTRNYNGTILFCYIDVWKALGFSCGTLLKRYLDGARFRYLETPTNQGIQIAGYIDEENLSRCIFRCKDRNLAASMENLVETQILPYYEGGNVAIDEPAKPKLIVKTKLCPELAEIIGEVFVVIEKFNDYKLAAGLTSEEFLPIHVAEQSLCQLKGALKILYDHTYIQDLERRTLPD